MPHPTIPPKHPSDETPYRFWFLVVLAGLVITVAIVLLVPGLALAQAGAPSGGAGGGGSAHPARDFFKNIFSDGHYILKGAWALLIGGALILPALGGKLPKMMSVIILGALAGFFVIAYTQAGDFITSIPMDWATPGGP